MLKNPINAAFGRAVALRRGELGLTQAALAVRVNMSRASIANIEKGRQNILLHHLYDFADALELPAVGDLLPVRPKTNVAVLELSLTDGEISAREAAQVNSAIASALATRDSKAKP